MLRRKARWEPERVAEELTVLLQVVRLVDVGLSEIRIAWRISGRYGYSHYDSLIIAAARAATCDTLFTEDLQHGQVIDGRLTLVNPFAGEPTTHQRA